MKELIGFFFQDFTKPIKPIRPRHNIIDGLRVLAVALMIIFHFSFDLYFFKIISRDLTQGFWHWFPRLIASLFLLTSGLTCGVQARKKTHSYFIRRGLLLLGWAAIISVTTLILFPSAWIFFGTLHCLAVCHLLVPIFKTQVIRLSVVIAIASSYIMLPWRLDKILAEHKIYSLDFIPLFPWLFWFCLGLLFSSMVRSKNRALTALQKPNHNTKSKFMSPSWLLVWQWSSQKTLVIYLLHQPILFGGLLAVQWFMNFASL